MGCPSEAKVADVVSQFRLRGEEVIRLSTGRPVVATQGARGYSRVHLSGARRYVLGLHQVKFILLWGWLPDRVDHENRDQADNTCKNLRAATHQQNMWNSGRRSLKRDLPRGVKMTPKGRYQARTGKKYLGSFDTKEEAEEAYRAFCAATRGRFTP